MDTLETLLQPRTSALEGWPGQKSERTSETDAPALLVVGKEISQQLKALNSLQDWREMSSLVEAIKVANETRPEALLIDASDDGETVRQMCSNLQYRPALAFASNNPLFAHHAFEMGAVDCLPKPLQPGRLAQALGRMQTWSKTLREANAITPPVSSADGLMASRWLRMVRNGSLLVAPLDEVVYFQAERKLTRVVLEGSDGYLHMGINAVAAKLDTQMFWRLHRSTIVNGRFVSVVQRDELGRLSVRMHGRPELLYVSKAHDALWRDGIF